MSLPFFWMSPTCCHLYAILETLLTFLHQSPNKEASAKLTKCVWIDLRTGRVVSTGDSLHCASLYNLPAKLSYKGQST